MMDGKGYMLCTELPIEERNCLTNYFRHIAPHPEEANTLVLYTYDKLMKYDTNLLWGFIRSNIPYIKQVVVFCPETTKTAEAGVKNLRYGISECYKHDITVDLYIQPDLCQRRCW